jgi:hypothetical protein
MSGHEPEQESSHVNGAPVSEDSGAAMLAPSSQAVKQSLRARWSAARASSVTACVGAALVLAITAGAWILLQEEKPAGSRPNTRSASQSPVSAASSANNARVTLSAKHVGGRSAKARPQPRLRHPCLIAKMGRKLCGWPAAQYCNRVVAHLRRRALLRSHTCLKLLRRFNQQRSRQYMLNQEPRA